MLFSHKDNEFEYYVSFFKDHRIRISREIKTGKIYFNAADVAAALGYSSAHEMISSDEGLDAMNEAMKETGEFPLKTIIQ